MIAQSLINDSPSQTPLKITLNNRLLVNQEASSGYTKEAPLEKMQTTSAVNHKKISPTPAEQYGYEDAVPDSKALLCGYEDSAVLYHHSPSGGVLLLSPPCSPTLRGTTTPRRSSLKRVGDAPRVVRRRASIHMGEDIAVRLPGRKEPVRRRSLISFDNEVRVRPIVPLSQLSSNPKTLWFQEDEFYQMKQKSWKIIHEELECKKQGGGTSRHCIRGLEQMLQHEEVKKNKYDSWDSVIIEQDIQREHGIFDEDYMAARYRMFTAKSQLEAQERAKDDEAEIRNYMRSTRKYIRRLSSA